MQQNDVTCQLHVVACPVRECVCVCVCAHFHLLLLLPGFFSTSNSRDLHEVRRVHSSPFVAHVFLQIFRSQFSLSLSFVK
jgi:hypothetical protein